MTFMQNNSQYTGTPEKHLSIPPGQDLDIDALSCALARARSVCAMMAIQLRADSDVMSDKLMGDGLWALCGLIDQAEIILEGSLSVTVSRETDT